MPSNAKLLPYRSNIEYLSEYCLRYVDENFPPKAKKAKEAGTGGIIVGGQNYGQGSSREHAALDSQGEPVLLTRFIPLAHAAAPEMPAFPARNIAKSGWPPGTAGGPCA